MLYSIPNTIFKSNLTATTILVYICLFNEAFTSNNGNTYFSAELKKSIVNNLHISKGTMSKCLSKLQAENLLKVENNTYTVFYNKDNQLVEKTNEWFKEGNFTAINEVILFNETLTAAEKIYLFQLQSVLLNDNTKGKYNTFQAVDTIYNLEGRASRKIRASLKEKGFISYNVNTENGKYTMSNFFINPTPSIKEEVVVENTAEEELETMTDYSNAMAFMNGEEIETPVFEVYPKRETKPKVKDNDIRTQEELDALLALI